MFLSVKDQINRSVQSVFKIGMFISSLIIFILLSLSLIIFWNKITKIFIFIYEKARKINIKKKENKEIIPLKSINETSIFPTIEVISEKDQNKSYQPITLQSFIHSNFF